MKAAVSTGVKREIVIKEIPKPSVKPGMLLMKVKCCSICGTDLEFLDNSLAYRPGGELKAGAILGHEYCAEVAEIGEGVSGWPVGDRATISGVRPTCGECYFCRNRMPQLCHGKNNERGIYTQAMPGGFGGQSGALTEYILRSPTALLKLPDGVTDEEGALVEPLNIGVGSVNLAKIEPGDSAVIIGAGKIGLGAMMMAKAAGASPIIVTDIHQNRLDKALEMGADVAINVKEQDFVEEIVKIIPPGPDVIFICVRDGEVLNESVELIRRGGKIIVVGQIAPTTMMPGMWIPKQLTIAAVFRQTPIIKSLDMISKKLVDVKPMVSEIFSLDEIQEACNSMWSGKNIVAMVKP